MKRSLLRAATLPALLLVVFLAGCGGGGGGEDSSSGSELAALAPPRSVVFLEGTVRPSGKLKADADAAAQRIGDIENLGDFVVEELESSAREDGEPFDYATEVEPWLGERVAFDFERVEGDDLSDPIVFVESTDPEATQEFVDHQAQQSDEPFRDASYEGVEYKFGGDEEDAIGVVDDLLVIAEDEPAFKRAVDASQGDSLADEAAYTEAISAATEGSLADAYVDVGAILEQSGDRIDPAAREILRNAGIDPSEATAVASLVPGADQIEIDLSSDLGGEEAPSGDASELLGTLPADSFAAVAVSGFGDQLDEAIDRLDEEGIADTVPPNQLKKGLKEFGIDLEEVAGSLRDAGIFAIGDTEGSLGGALVMSAEGSTASDAIARIGQLLRQTNVDGVTALGGRYDGFSIRSEDLGRKPLVVAATEGRVAIGYGVPATLIGLRGAAGPTLADSPAYDDAVASLGSLPIRGFADGPAALRLADALISSSDEDFEEAKKYLKSIRFLALGSEPDGDRATAKLIAGLK
jgi:Protein of unknown function (DUF3352)